MQTFLPSVSSLFLISIIAVLIYWISWGKCINCSTPINYTIESFWCDSYNVGHTNLIRPCPSYMITLFVQDLGDWWYWGVWETSMPEKNYSQHTLLWSSENCFICVCCSWNLYCGSTEHWVCSMPCYKEITITTSGLLYCHALSSQVSNWWFGHHWWICQTASVICQLFSQVHKRLPERGPNWKYDNIFPALSFCKKHYIHNFQLGCHYHVPCIDITVDDTHEWEVWIVIMNCRMNS